MGLNRFVRVVGFVALWGLAGFSASVSADALSDAQRLIKQGKPAEALALLEPLQGERAGDPAFDFLLGVALIDAGRPAEGVFALERVLDVAPQNVAARAEIARAYFLLGENENAKREFNRAKEQQPSDGVDATIDKFLSAIDSRLSGARAGFRGFAEGTIGFDDNVNSATNDTTLAVPALGLTVTLADASREQQSFFYGGRASGRYAHALRSDIQAFIGGGFSFRDHPEARAFDQKTFDAMVGLQHFRGRDQFTVSMNGQLFRVDDSINRRLWGGNAQWQRKLTEQDRFTLFAQAGRQNFPGQSVRDVDFYTVGAALAHAYAARGRPVVFASIYGGIEEEDNDARPDLGRVLYGARLGGQYNVRNDVTAFGSVVYQKSNYGASDPLFLARRKDNLLDISIGANYRPARNWVISPQARYTSNNSKLVLNDYDRAQVFVTVRRSFD